MLTIKGRWDWWLILLLGWNIMLPMLMTFCMANNEIEMWRQLHEFLAKISMLSNIFIFFALTWRWAFFCNNSYSAMQSAANDYRYCCAGFPSPWCPNNGPCTPNYSYSDLSRNYEMTQHWIFSLVFFILSCWSYNQAGELVNLGVLQ